MERININGRGWTLHRTFLLEHNICSVNAYRVERDEVRRLLTLIGHDRKTAKSKTGRLWMRCVDFNGKISTRFFYLAQWSYSKTALGIGCNVIEAAVVARLARWAGIKAVKRG